MENIIINIDDIERLHIEALETLESYVDDVIAAEVKPGRLKTSDVLSQASLHAYEDEDLSRQVVSYMRHRRFIKACRPYVELRIKAANSRLNGGLKKEAGDMHWPLLYEQEADAMMVKLKKLDLKSWELGSMKEHALSSIINRLADCMDART